MSNPYFRMVLVLFLLILLVFAFCGRADAHMPNSGFTSEKYEKRSNQIINRHIKNEYLEHYAKHLAYCETSLRHWLRGTYNGWFQFNRDAMRQYGIGWRDGKWYRGEQVESFKRMYWATIGVRDPWPSC